MAGLHALRPNPVLRQSNKFPLFAADVVFAALCMYAAG